MIRVDRNETFPILVQLVNEETAALASGETVYYDIRAASNDAPLAPPVARFI